MCSQLLLCSLYEIYRALEEELERNADHPAVQPIYFPQELARLESLELDLEHFFGPHWRKRVTVPAATHRYTQRLREASLGKISLRKWNCIYVPVILIITQCSRFPFRSARTARISWWHMHIRAILVICQEDKCWVKLPRNLWDWAATREFYSSCFLEWRAPTDSSSCTGAEWTALS